MRDQHGYEPIAYADALKEMAVRTDPLISADLHLSGAVEEWGWEYVKDEYPEARRFLQRLGTEGVRGVLGDDTWARRVHDTIRENPNQKWVISDMRFPIEYDLLVSAFPDAHVFQVTRPGTHEDNHSSEHHLDRTTHDTIRNDGSMEHLAHHITFILENA